MLCNNPEVPWPWEITHLSHITSQGQQLWVGFGSALYVSSVLNSSLHQQPYLGHVFLEEGKPCDGPTTRWSLYAVVLKLSATMWHFCSHAFSQSDSWAEVRRVGSISSCREASHITRIQRGCIPLLGKPENNWKQQPEDLKCWNLVKP